MIAPVPVHCFSINFRFRIDRIKLKYSVLFVSFFVLFHCVYLGLSSVSLYYQVHSRNVLCCFIACTVNGLTQLILCLISMHHCICHFSLLLKSSCFSHDSTCYCIYVENIDIFSGMFISYYLSIISDYFIVFGWHKIVI